MKLTNKYQLHKIVSTDNLQPALRCVKYEGAGNGRLIATNGHVLASVPIEKQDQDTSSDQLIKAEAIKDLLKIKGNAQLIITKEKALNTVTDVTYSHNKEDQYPNWERVVPNYDYEETITIGIDAKALLALAQAMDCQVVKLTIPVARLKQSPAIPYPLLASPTDDENKAYGAIMTNRIN